MHVHFFPWNQKGGHRKAEGFPKDILCIGVCIFLSTGPPSVRRIIETTFFQCPFLRPTFASQRDYALFFSTEIALIYSFVRLDDRCESRLEMLRFTGIYQDSSEREARINFTAVELTDGSVNCFKQVLSLSRMQLHGREDSQKLIIIYTSAMLIHNELQSGRSNYNIF